MIFIIPKGKKYGQNQYKIKWELLAIQEYAIHSAPLDKNSILNRIIEQLDNTIVRSLLDRMVTEAEF